jgi:hypothetical protein
MYFFIVHFLAYVNSILANMVLYNRLYMKKKKHRRLRFFVGIP